MKNNEAPLAWIERINHPLLTSRWIWEIMENAVEISLEKFIDKNKPVIIWAIKQNPNNEPKFHIYEILDGVGKFLIGWINLLINISLHFNYIF